MKYKLICLYTCLLTLCGSGSSLTAQTIHLQSGVAVSSLNWELINGGIFYDDAIISPSVFVGIDYLKKKYYNLSSNIGYIRKGGSDVLQMTDALGNELGMLEDKITLDYVSLNTTFDVLIPAVKDKLFPFFSVGPRIDFLVANSERLDSYKKLDELHKTSYGLIIGTGIRYAFSRIELGIRADYLANFNKIVYYEDEGTFYSSLKDKTALVSFTVGYRLK